jgi:hypothetical protein
VEADALDQLVDVLLAEAVVGARGNAGRRRISTHGHRVLEAGCLNLDPPIIRGRSAESAIVIDTAR